MFCYHGNTVLILVPASWVIQFFRARTAWQCISYSDLGTNINLKCVISLKIHHFKNNKVDSIGPYRTSTHILHLLGLTADIVSF